MQEERISKTMGYAMIIVAICIDIAEMGLEWLGIGIAGISTLISICTACGFFVWFKMYRVTFADDPSKFLIFTGGATLELIPGMDAVGGFFWTVTIWKLVDIVRKEDGASDIIPVVGRVVTKQTFSPRVANVIKK